jgi:hypothetical protein
MKSIILGLPDDIKSGSGGDQAVHNYLLHYNLVQGVKTMDNFERVATLHLIESSDLNINSNGHIVNPDGSISEIVHQWDRHPPLADAISEKYAASLPA